MDNTLCQGENPIRFYAGAILRTLDGWPMGTLCVLDFKPRRLNDFQKRALIVNANSVTRQLELTRFLVEKVELDEHQVSGSSLSEEESGLIEHIDALFQKLTSREREVLKLIAGNTKAYQVRKSRKN